MRARELVGHLQVGRFQNQLAAIGHGVARIYRDVQNYLLDLAGIRTHGLEIRGQGRNQFDVLSHHAPQHPIHVPHQQH